MLGGQAGEQVFERSAEEEQPEQEPPEQPAQPVKVLPFFTALCRYLAAKNTPTAMMTMIAILINTAPYMIRRPFRHTVRYF